MHAITHYLIGWSIAAPASDQRRDRTLIALSAMSPDIDALGGIVDLVARVAGHPTNYFGEYHHIIGHNIGFGLLITAICGAVAINKLRTAAFVLLSFHIHLLCDILGARGPAEPAYPDGFQWPIP